MMADGSKGLSLSVAPTLYIEIPQITRASSRDKHASDSQFSERAYSGPDKAYRRTKSRSTLHQGSVNFEQ